MGVVQSRDDPTVLLYLLLTFGIGEKLATLFARPVSAIACLTVGSLNGLMGGQFMAAGGSNPSLLTFKFCFACFVFKALAATTADPIGFITILGTGGVMGFFMDGHVVAEGLNEHFILTVISIGIRIYIICIRFIFIIPILGMARLGTSRILSFNMYQVVGMNPGVILGTFGSLCRLSVRGKSLNGLLGLSSLALGLLGGLLSGFLSGLLRLLGRLLRLLVRLLSGLLRRLLGGLLRRRIRFEGGGDSHIAGGHGKEFTLLVLLHRHSTSIARDLVADEMIASIRRGRQVYFGPLCRFVLRVRFHRTAGNGRVNVDRILAFREREGGRRQREQHGQCHDQCDKPFCAHFVLPNASKSYLPIYGIYSLPARIRHPMQIVRAP